jgi:hypothetical protein
MNLVKWQMPTVVMLEIGAFFHLHHTAADCSRSSVCRTVPRVQIIFVTSLVVWVSPTRFVCTRQAGAWLTKTLILGDRGTVWRPLFRSLPSRP